MQRHTTQPIRQQTQIFAVRFCVYKKKHKIFTVYVESTNLLRKRVGASLVLLLQGKKLFTQYIKSTNLLPFKRLGASLVLLLPGNKLFTLYIKSTSKTVSSLCAALLMRVSVCVCVCVCSRALM